MKLEYNKEVDAAYIYLEDVGKKSSKTVEISEHIVLDFNEKGKIIGIEILDASKMLNKKTLLEAQPV